MSTTTVTRRHRRFGAAGALAAMIAAALTVVAPAAPASADPGHTCVPADLGTFHYVEDRWLYVVRFLEPVTETFFVSDLKREENGAETVKPVEYTDVTSTTFTLKTGVTLSTAATEKFSDKMREVSSTRTLGFSQETTYAKTTSFTRKETVNVPPMGQTQSQYGVVGYRILYSLTVWYKDLQNGVCRQQGFAGSVVAETPTDEQKWKTVYWPTIGQGGVVNAANYSAADVHPGTTVAIFGQYFVPDDRVTVRQGGRTWSLGPGTSWWYDSSGQINTTLPGDLTPGTSAQITVTGGNGLTSNTRSVFIQP